MVEKSLGSVGNRTAIPRLSIQRPDHFHNGYCTSIHVLNVHMFNIPKQFTGFEACVAVWLRPSLLWDVTQPILCDVTQLILCYVTPLILCDVTQLISCDVTKLIFWNITHLCSRLFTDV